MQPKLRVQRHHSLFVVSAFHSGQEVCERVEALSLKRLIGDHSCELSFANKPLLHACLRPSEVRYRLPLKEFKQRGYFPFLFLLCTIFTVVRKCQIVFNVRCINLMLEHVLEMGVYYTEDELSLSKEKKKKHLKRGKKDASALLNFKSESTQ